MVRLNDVQPVGGVTRTGWQALSTAQGWHLAEAEDGTLVCLDSLLKSNEMGKYGDHS